jgi:hypothetical protein
MCFQSAGTAAHAGVRAVNRLGTSDLKRFKISSLRVPETRPLKPT